ncbi:DUF4393 domain-containing protein [Lachnospiraceae bacterium 38-14]
MKDLVKETVKQLPKEVYDDLAHPGLSVLGQTVSDIFKFVALPFSFLGLTADELTEKYKTFIKEAINKTPSNKVKQPDPLIVCPLLDYVKYTFNESELSELFNNLLSSSINKDMENIIHPSFVHIIKQLSGLDAQILKGLYGYGEKYILYDNISIYNRNGWGSVSYDISGLTLLNVEKNFSINSTKTSIDYLISLGLLKLQLQKKYTKEDYYSVIKSHMKYRDQFDNIQNFKYKPNKSKYLDGFLNKAYEEGKKYPHKDEYNLVPIEDREIEFCDMEICSLIEKAMSDISKSTSPRSPVGCQYILPERGYLSFTEIGKRFMKCCT